MARLAVLFLLIPALLLAADGPVDRAIDFLEGSDGVGMDFSEYVISAYDSSIVEGLLEMAESDDHRKRWKNTYQSLGLILSVDPEMSYLFDRLVDLATEIEDREDMGDVEKVARLNRPYMAIGRGGVARSMKFFEPRISGKLWGSDPPGGATYSGHSGRHIVTQQALAIKWIKMHGEEEAYEYLEKMKVELDAENDDTLSRAFGASLHTGPELWARLHTRNLAWFAKYHSPQGGETAPIGNSSSRAIDFLETHDREGLDPIEYFISKYDSAIVEGLLGIVESDDYQKYWNDSYRVLGLILSIDPERSDLFARLVDLATEIENREDMGDVEKAMRLNFPYMAVGKGGFSRSKSFFEPRISGELWVSNPPGGLTHSILGQEIITTQQTLAIMCIKVLGEEEAYEYLEKMKVELNAENDATLSRAFGASLHTGPGLWRRSHFQNLKWFAKYHSQQGGEAAPSDDSSSSPSDLEPLASALPGNANAVSDQSSAATAAAPAAENPNLIWVLITVLCLAVGGFLAYLKLK